MKNHRLVILLFAIFPWVVFSGCDAGTKSVDSCGDSFVDPGEECDTDVGENTCASLGHYDALGELKCTDGCKFDRSDCGGRCGDNLVDVGDAEQCDGENLNGKSCQSLGYGGGELACSPICQFVLTGCTNACGNGYIEGDEACDDGNNRSGDGCSTACVVEEGWACEAGNPSACAPVCLDGQVVGDEDCDMENLDGETCVGLGYYGGELECDFSCAFDESDCAAAGRCGDGAIQGDFSEVCDGAELGGQSCEGLGYYGGTLACQANCRGFDVTGCAGSGRCGDNVIQADHGEVCDGFSLGGRNCQDEGYFTGTLACDADCAGYDVSGCVVISTCGDGEVQTVNGEVCDGLNLNGLSCVTRGYYAGDLACREHCMGFDESQCQGRCGDATVQSAAGEVCDGAELVGQTCADQGFYAGTLACSANCTSFNVIGCSGYCGDGTVQNTHGEVCDGLNHGGQTCLTQGYYGGTLTCNPNCQTFGLADCAAVGRCGDSLVQGGFGELCDGNNLSGQTCTSRGYYGGTLACASTCNGFVESGCAAVGRCGDGVIQSAYGEVCDGGNLASQTCESRGFYGGILTCSADCRAFVETNCAAVGRCGDGTIQGGYGEECDGSNLAGQTCASQGFNPGTLSCSDCQFVTSGCNGFCGDGNIQSTYEQCDGLNLGGADCVSRGFYTGTLGCNVSSCQYDTGGCQYFCGDGATQTSFGEACDGADFNGQTCETQGYYPGSLSCSGGCAFQFGSCGGYCGDSLVQTSFGEECDGSNLNGQSCRSLGYFTGGLECHSSCNYDNTCVDLELIDAGYYDMCALLKDGSARCWGNNGFGKLGDGTTNDRNTPTKVAIDDPIVALSAGPLHTCAVLTTGSVKCWGNNSNGQLGDGTLSTRINPVFVSGLTNAIGIELGEYHTCAILNDNSVKCWGYNGYGHLGDGTYISSRLPVQCVDLVNVSKISSGQYHNCALLTDGSIKCWGSNGRGQLGLSGSGYYNIAQTVSGISSVLDVAVGGEHTCAVTNSGSVYCWGWNIYGQLGDGSYVDKSVPTNISTINNANKVAAGRMSSCAIKVNGTISCWGQNTYGELGNGLTEDSNIPVDVISISDSTFVALGYGFACSLSANKKTIKCWGKNDAGQLGDGTNINRLSPVVVLQ